MLLEATKKACLKHAKPTVPDAGVAVRRAIATPRGAITAAEGICDRALKRVEASLTETAEAKASLRSCLSSHAKVRAELHHSVRNYKDRWDVNIKNYSKYPYISRHSGALYSYVGTSTCRYINIKQDLRQDLSRDSNAAFAKTARPAAHTAAACTRATSRGGARFHGGAGGAVSLAVSARCRMATSTDAMTENGCTTAAARPGQSAPAT